MHVLILAGGGGTRLWPLSRQQFPKQFLELFPEALSPSDAPPQVRSLLLDTIRRVEPLHANTRCWLVTAAALVPCLQSHLLDAGLETLLPNVLVEPEAKNTAPAIALALRTLRDSLQQQHGQADPNTPVVILPADHAIPDSETFSAHVQRAATLAQAGWLVTLGVVPTSPHTGYGYIQASTTALPQGGYAVSRFVEKPTRERAECLLAQGGYFWNAGVFVASLGTLMDAFCIHAPEIAKLFSGSPQDALATFASVPKLPIDIAIMEKASNVAVIPLETSWSDVGSWESIYAESPKDPAGNALLSTMSATETLETPAQFVASQGNLVHRNTHRHIALVGIDDCIVVDTPDALLVMRHNHPEGIKAAIAPLQAQNAPVFTQPFPVVKCAAPQPLAERSATPTVYPWGMLTVFRDATQETPAVAEVVIHPGQRAVFTLPQVNTAESAAESTWTLTQGQSVATHMTTAQEQALPQAAKVCAVGDTIMCSPGQLLQLTAGQHPARWMVSGGVPQPVVLPTSSRAQAVLTPSAFALVP